MTRRTDIVFDELLLIEAQTGNLAAAERLAKRWQPRLLRTARRYTQNEEMAREAVQETWIAIHRGLGGLEDTSRFPAWAFRILRYKSVDLIRKQQRRRQNEYDEVEGVDVSIGTDMAETRLALNQAFAALNEDLRFTAILFFGEGLNLAETAEAAGIPVGTVKSRLHTARKLMQSSLKGDM